MLQLVTVATVERRDSRKGRKFHELILTGFIYSACLSFATKFKTKELDRKIRVGAVSYLNTKPLLYGIERSELMHDIELITDYPARIADRLLNDEIDIGLVPVETISRMKTFYINSGYCIGSHGPVASVCLFSEVPLEKLETVLLDDQSRTSVALLKILLREYWKQSPAMKEASGAFSHRIAGNTGAVMIGDRALAQRKISPFIYDLGEAWTKMTGLPFVYAAWVSNKPLDETFLARFNEANGEGLKQLDAVIRENPSSLYDLNDYFKNHIDYRLDEAKKQGLQKFLGYLKTEITGSAVRHPVFPGARKTNLL
jgi:chorismate dehydratase